MDADAATPKALFDGHRHYEIPSFQRPYVWSEEDQWSPLWRDVLRVAEARSTHPGAEHFLGAVVLKSVQSAALEPTRFAVIDGQQRLTTLQLLLDACHQAIVDLAVEGGDDFAESLANLILNNASRFEGEPFRFKLWPSRSDRSAFERTMDDKLSTQGIDHHRIVEAHAFFRTEAGAWLGSPESALEQLERVALLTAALQDGLNLVAITLGESEDDHTIFETLNDRGTPLLKADLIKNWILQTAGRLGADADAWADSYWDDLDDAWWREEVRQGRLYRSRIDLFLQYWLTMKSEDDILVEDVFKAFRQFFTLMAQDVVRMEEALESMRNDANTYRELVTGVSGSSVSAFHQKVVETLELGAFMPIALRLLAHGSAIGEEQRSVALDALESWAVRRTVLRQTMQGLNNLVVSLLKHVSKADDASVGLEIRNFLAAQTADTRTWPTDADIESRLPTLGLYGSIRQPRIRLVLEAVERALRTELVEDVGLPSGLEIEHVMPRGWREHWGDGVIDDPTLVQRRDACINTIGNLTLVTKKLNGSLSHRPWTDTEAIEVAPSGSEAGKGKRDLLSRSSILMLNKRLVDDHPSAWTEDDVEARGALIAAVVRQAWKRPSGEIEIEIESDEMTDAGL